MAAYYNEIDPFAAKWLRELIAAGHIADGEIDTRSIEDVTPNDLRGFTQCHFFAGIGGWSYALRLAGWPDDRPIWTGSCPCQPFSSAGEGAGFNDERHLWPAFFWLIEQSRPRVVVGEQVASGDALAWLDLVSTDLEGADYAVAAADLCAAGLGAPQLRQRLYWLAHREIHGCGEECPHVRGSDARDGAEGLRTGPVRSVADGGMADAHRERSIRQHARVRAEDDGRNAATATLEADRRGAPVSRLGDTGCAGLARRSRQSRDDAAQCATVERASRHAAWSAVEWLPGRDGKMRPIEPGLEPLATGVPARVGRLRGYGNAVVPQVAAAFITAYMESEL